MKMVDKIKQALSPDQFKNIRTIKENKKSLIVEYKLKGENTGFTYDFSKDYLRVITNEKEDRAEMLVYGYVGQDFWFDEELNKESITDLAFVRSLRELEAKYNRIDVRINSPGGSVFHGDPIITALRNSKAEIHTYCDGMCASMAFDIWLVGDVRHTAVNSKFMSHATSSIEIGTAQDMRDAAERLDKFDDAAVATFAKVTDLEEAEIRARFYDDYKDHWLSSEDVMELGLVKSIDDDIVEEQEEKTVKELYKQVTKVEIVKEKEELTSDEMITKLKVIHGDKLTLEIEKKADKNDLRKYKLRLHELTASN